ncbi:MAG: hypothetical protein A3C36_04850 [Omnitrophica WOR_2 bacterium RIFCSPHIGHO2_02_FULL_52_10]|nr:MAG: hypothetical protein A3C36_04850 [Omnitrophica WOR_2 bacterium RIFCSPHIGHO2_02_FULL_52_10]
MNNLKRFKDNFRSFIIAIPYIVITVVVSVLLMFFLSNGFTSVKYFISLEEGRWHWLWKNLYEWFSQGVEENLIILFRYLSSLSVLFVYGAVGCLTYKLLKKYTGIRNERIILFITIALMLIIMILFHMGLNIPSGDYYE